MTARLAITAASLKTRARRGVYYLAPHVGRLSFVSQQQRALGLVWALREIGELTPDSGKKRKRVAVVGAGLAGVTATVAALGFGCHVDLFEKGGMTFPRQRDTTHRRVYPHINRWPAADSLSPTTELPFLDWHAGQCNEVINDLDQQFEALTKPFTGTFTRCFGVTVTGTESTPAGVVLELEDTASPLPYDAVVIAIGFDDEAEDSAFGTPAYWVSDSLKRERDTDVRCRFAVSGCGDGGLIDALRMAYGGFDDGQLAFEVAELLTGTPVADTIKAAEREFDEVHSDLDPAHADDAITRASRDITTAYTNCAGSIHREEQYDEVKFRLDAAIAKDPRNPLAYYRHLVTLVDRSHASPYDGKAAPIHKLLVAYAEIAKVIQFSPGELKRRGDKAIEAGGKVVPSPCTGVLRHGARPRYEGILGKDELGRDEVARLEKIQRLYADLANDRLWTSPFPKPEGTWPDEDRTSVPFRLSRLPQLKRYLEEHCKRRKALGVGPVGMDDLVVDLDGDGFAVISRAALRGDPPVKSDPPEKLFGVHVDYRSCPEADFIG